MIPVRILNKLKEKNEVYNFIENTDDFEVLVKRLNLGEIKRIASEYPELLKIPLNQITNNDTISKTYDIKKIISFTLVKNDLDNKNIVKLKKIKFYIDELNDNIIKILQN